MKISVFFAVLTVALVYYGVRPYAWALLLFAGFSAFISIMSFIQWRMERRDASARFPRT